MRGLTISFASSRIGVKFTKNTAMFGTRMTVTQRSKPRSKMIQNLSSHPAGMSFEEATILDGPKHGKISEIASFRGRFCDQARNGDSIVAQGKVEKVTDIKKDREYYRLLIGNKPSDYMIVV